MAKKIKEWASGSISIAVEAGKDDANREGPHVHIYKRGRRTNSRIPGDCPDLDSKDADVAYGLYNDHLSEIYKLCEAVARGEYDS